MSPAPRLRNLVPAALVALVLPCTLAAQQVADSAFAPPMARPAFAPGAGPLVAIDGGHHNFHTAEDRFSPFAELLRRDGWRVEGRTGSFTRESLADVRVLVIANALAERNLRNWSLPTPSAFTDAEIDVLVEWIRAGGSLLLIADHMPFPGAADALARRLGFEMRNGFAGTPADEGVAFVFRRADGSLRPDALAEGHGDAASIDSVRSFTGQAFRALADDVRPLMVLPADAISREPEVAWEFADTTPAVPVGGWLQGAARELGAGRVVVMGEAAMFTAQLAGPERMRIGMNSPNAPQNYRLALEVVRWLGHASRHASGRASPPALERVISNDNRTAAGTLRDGTLSMDLVARDGEWHPDAGPGERMYAFAEGEGPPRIPGPFIRVPAGTTVRARVRNALPDTLRLYGMHDRVASGTPDRRPLRIVPGSSRDVVFRLDAPGTYHYWGATSDSALIARYGPETQLIGGIVVDAPGTRVDDRVFVISSWTQLPDSSGPEPWVYRDMVAVNGKSWPHTERFAFTAGDTVRWRWINPDSRPHPMHLHGFYFDVLSRGDGATDTIFEAGWERRGVTETLVPGSTMSVRFVPERPGRWLFHCHIAFHVSHFLSFARIPDPEDLLAGDDLDHSVHGMAGLILAMDVAPRPGADVPRAPVAGRAVRLHVTGGMVTVGDAQQERLAYVVERDGVAPAADSVPLLSAPVVLRRGEPVLVTILNRTRVPTAVHWHGIEVEDAYADGVPGFSGSSSSSTTPLIAPGDSFVAAFTPPRSGTFMLHSHSNEMFQIDAGLAAPLIVMDDPADYDPRHDVVVMVTGDGIGFENEGAWVNGAAQPAPIELAADGPTRLRMISINAERVLLFTLLAGGDTLTWRPLAKDGADLPPNQAVVGPAHRRIGVGEIVDVEVGPLDRPAVLAIRPIRPFFRIELPVVTRAD